MGKVDVDDLKEGMVLASELVGPTGRFLLGQGTVLEDKHLRIMKIWGITAADIEGVDQEEMTQQVLTRIAPEILQKAREYVDLLFCNSSESHDALKELKRLCLLRTAEKLEKGYSLPDFKIEETEKITPPKEKIIPMHDLVDKNTKLSSFPEIYHQIIDVLNNPRSSASHVAEVVSKDTSLSATLLKLVNSAFYGLPTKVDSITHAVALIGGRELTTLAMAVSVLRYFKNIPPEMVDMKNFWLHSIACGVIARVLANRKMELTEEQFFLGGLMHDIGSLILFKEFPQTMVYAIGLSHRRRVPLYQVEQEVLGYDHARVAGLILEQWNFPSLLVQMILYHHSPLKARSPLEPAIINVANIMATTLRFGDSGNRFASPFEKSAWDTIGLPPGIFNSSIKQADRQVYEILSAFRLDNMNYY